MKRLACWFLAVGLALSCSGCFFPVPPERRERGGREHGEHERRGGEGERERPGRDDGDRGGR
jgi:hypothetical protein